VALLVALLLVGIHKARKRVVEDSEDGLSINATFDVKGEHDSAALRHVSRKVRLSAAAGT